MKYNVMAHIINGLEAIGYSPYSSPKNELHYKLLGLNDDILYSWLNSLREEYLEVKSWGPGHEEELVRIALLGKKIKKELVDNRGFEKWQ